MIYCSRLFYLQEDNMTKEERKNLLKAIWMLGLVAWCVWFAWTSRAERKAFQDRVEMNAAESVVRFEVDHLEAMLRSFRSSLPPHREYETRLLFDLYNSSIVLEEYIDVNKDRLDFSKIRLESEKVSDLTKKFAIELGLALNRDLSISRFSENVYGYSFGIAPVHIESTLDTTSADAIQREMSKLREKFPELVAIF